jgi:hypothetical protein
MLLRDDEHVVWLNNQPFRDQFNRHSRELREDIMQHSRDRPHMIDDDDCDTHIRWKMLEQPGIGIETPGGTADANDGEPSFRPGDVHHGFLSPSAATSECGRAKGSNRGQSGLAINPDQSRVRVYFI